jgi:membrane protein DedA with SNARE-associated domain
LSSAAAVSVPFVFALAYFFTDQIGAILADVHRVERWLALAALIGLTGGVVGFVMRSNRRVSKAP